MASFYLIWQQNGVTLTGKDSSGNYINNALVFNINYPGNLTEAQNISVSSSAQTENTFNTLTNVGIYLTGDPVSLEIVQQLWPTLGNGYYPVRADLNGGFQISFDGGSNYTTFDPSTGVEGQPNTYITLPALAVGINGETGTLGAFDVANFIIRLIIPPGAVEYQQLNIALALDFDII
jgi:hypothetical protein